MKITILGAAGGIGQALSLLLKNQLSSGSELSLYDISSSIIGIAADLNHIPTNVKVFGFFGKNIKHALKESNIVIISAGVSRKPGMKRADLFYINSNIISKLIENIINICPNTLICIITNPINTTVVIAAEILKKAGVYDKKKLLGITTLDIIRSNTFVSELKNKNAKEIEVLVIGGHSETTILPLLSHLEKIHLTDEEIIILTKRIQNAGTEIVKAKSGNGSATLSMGYAAARLCLSVIRGMQGEKNIIECVYTEGDRKYARFFAQPVMFGKNGIEKYLQIGNLSSFEKKILKNMLKTLKSDIKLGEEFIKNYLI
ncbi:Malate dehydrogenase [Candidatus Providencia siddallii]|uniref:Malate dehydrogenase n=1 Tax=Candidatus Providencia siddallii TaxID=1715285 RepID=A0A0M6W6Z7_9GAMM|nr:Malate dehydrogenase [Candidatus Providencia siddallii]